MDYKFNIEKTAVKVKSDTAGWNLELNLVSWGGRKSNWEFRKWSEDHSKFGKGCTMSEDEVVLLFQKSKEILEFITGEVIEDKPKVVSEQVVVEDVKYEDKEAESESVTTLEEVDLPF